MFIASSNERQQFVTRLLEERFSSDVLQILIEEDQKQFTFARNQMKEKMPKELHPRQWNAAGKKENLSTKHAFPTMFDSADKKTYEYVRDDLSALKKIAIAEFDKIKISEISQNNQHHLQHQLELPPILKEHQFTDKQMSFQDKKQIVKSNKSKVEPAPKSMTEPSFFPNNQNKFAQTRSPFVANNLNFNDQFANSKSIQIKYPHLNFTQNSRNITSIAQSAKFNAFSQSVAYPTTVMAGTLLPPRQNMFSRDNKMDVTDVMKYTLGVRKNSQSKTPMQNPFERPPKKRQ